MFHALADGSGALAFLKTLVFNYLTLCTGSLNPDGKILTNDSPICEREMEDSFIANCKPLKIKDIPLKSMAGPGAAFTPAGKLFKTGGIGVTTGVLSTKAMLAFCRGKECTITEYIGGLLMYSIYATKGRNTTNKNIVITIPINLRPMYDSVTLQNFISYTMPGLSLSNPDLTLNDFISEVKHGLAQEMAKASTDNCISSICIPVKKMLPRCVPLFIKTFICKAFFYKLNHHPQQTAPYSNLGKVDLPDDMLKHIDNVYFIVTANKYVRYGATTISLADNLSITLSRAIVDSEIEQFFFSHLADNGLDITIYSNYREVENAL